MKWTNEIKGSYDASAKEKVVGSFFVPNDFLSGLTSCTTPMISEKQITQDEMIVNIHG
jgi:hypothetical protein